MIVLGDRTRDLTGARLGTGVNPLTLTGDRGTKTGAGAGIGDRGTNSGDAGDAGGNNDGGGKGLTRLRANSGLPAKLGDPTTYLTVR